MFSDYANLQARHDAPRTTLEAYNVPEVQWEPLGHAAGGLGKWKVFAVIGAVVVRELRAKRSVIVNCIYAAFREIVASFLTHVVEIKFGQETSSAASNGPVKIEVARNKKKGAQVTVLIAKQVRGSTADVVLSVFTERSAEEPEYLAQSKDVIN